MATHLVAYYKSSYAESDVEMTALQDDVLTRTVNTRYSVPPEINRVRWLAALGTNLTSAVLKAPSLDVRRTTVKIHPHVTGSTSFPLAYQAVMKPTAPIDFVVTEDLAVLLSTGGASAGGHYALLSFGPTDLPPIPSGDIRIVRATGSTTLVPNQWTSVPITPDVALEAGQYTLIGFLPISATCIAARALIPGQLYRPGVIGIAGSEPSALQYTSNLFSDLQPYAMGSFTHTTLPQFQYLGSGADTSQVVYMYLVKTG